MATDRRRAAATAGVGYGLVGAGGVLRGQALDDAHRDLGLTHRMMPPAQAVYAARRWKLPRAARHTRRWAGGTALVAFGAPAAAKGTLDLVHRNKTVTKRDRRRSPGLVREGVAGTTEAWKDKAQGFRSGAPLGVRAVPVGVGALAGAGGSLAAHRTLDLIARRRRVPPRLRAGITTAAAVPAVVASLPLTRRWTRRHGYDPQAAGGLRPIGKLYTGKEYLGRHVSGPQQRLRVYAAGGTPVVGPAAAVRQAGRYAPPGGRRSAMTRQAVGGPGAAYAGGVAGAYGLAHLAEYSPTVARHTQRAADAGEHLKARGLRAVGIERDAKPTGELGGLARRVAATRAGRPLFSSPRRAVGAFVGYSAGKAIAGQVGGNLAINRNLAAQRRYNDKHTHLVHKAATLTPDLTQRQAHTLARRKRRSARMSIVGGTAGLAALGLQVASRRPGLNPIAAERMIRRRDTALTVGAGVGGLNALTNAAIQRREAKAIGKSLATSTWVVKRQPLATSLTDDEADHLVHGRGGYGLTGTLPHQLDRTERKRAYEARYLAAGGRKAEHWQRRAQGAEVSRNAGVAGGTLAGAAWLAAGSPRLKRLARASGAGRRVTRGLTEHKVKQRAERAAVGAATLAGGSELSGEYARHKRGSYASAPAGVAASALRRMQAYDPQ